MKIKVSDMMCKHCVNSIDKALADIEHTISLEDKEVEVKDEDKDEAIELIEEAGFTVE